MNDKNKQDVAFFNKVQNEEILGNLFSKFKEKEIKYCVLRNYESFSYSFNDDIDILIDSEDLKKLEVIIASEVSGLLELRKVYRNDHILFYLVGKSELRGAIRQKRQACIIQLDFQTTLQWNGIKYLETSSVLEAREAYRNFYIPSSQHRSVHLLCHSILDKKSFKGKYEEAIKEMARENGKLNFDSLMPKLGKTMVDGLVSEFSCEGGTGVLKLRKQMCRTLLFESIESLGSCLRFLAKKYVRIARATLFPPGILIATAGPDGAGKSTLLNEIRNILSGAFSPVASQYMGWKEFMLPTKWVLNRMNKKAQIQSKIQRNFADPSSDRPVSWIHNFSVLHYLLDLWCRYIFRIRPILMRGGLVVCDRYFYDILVQDVWVCQNSWAKSILLALTPTPTVTVIFTGDPAVIAGRKDEISAVEVQRQFLAFLYLKNRKGSVLELEATRPLSENLEILFNHLFWKFEKRHSQ